MSEQEVLPPEDKAPDEAQQQAVVTTSDKLLTPAMLLQVAVQQNQPVEALEKLMDLRDRWEAKEAEKAFIVDLNKFKADPPEIFKNKKVGFETRGEGADVSYEHATLDHVSSVCGKALAAHGISHRWDVNQGTGEDKRITVTCILTHKKGHSERVSIHGWPDDSGKKNHIQQIASTITYLQRYTLLAATGLAPANMIDDDGQGGGAFIYIDVDQKAELIEAMKKLGCEEFPERQAGVLKYLKIESIDDLPDDEFDHAMEKIAEKQAKLDKESKADDSA